MTGEAGVRPEKATTFHGLAVRTVALAKTYGDVHAVRGLDLSIRRGTVFGLIGPNGAGKTTTFSILASLVRPTDGVVEVLGLDPVHHSVELRSQVGYMPDGLGLYEDLDTTEYLHFFASAHGVARSERADRVEKMLHRVDLTEKRSARVTTLSRGMKQRLSLARALIHDPQLVILDEPANGLDPRARVHLRHLLGGLKAAGTTVIISSHILAELEELCDEVAILVAGEIVAMGPPRKISSQGDGPRRVRVRLADGRESFTTVEGDAVQERLLQRLIDEGHAVIDYSRVDTGLEQLFLSLTDSDQSRGSDEDQDNAGDRTEWRPARDPDAEDPDAKGPDAKDPDTGGIWSRLRRPR